MTRRLVGGWSGRKSTGTDRAGSAGVSGLVSCEPRDFFDASWHQRKGSDGTTRKDFYGNE